MSRIRVVLVRPQVAGNIGAVARAMENFAAGELVLVRPEANPTGREALERSTHGEHRLHAARIVETLEQALDGVVFAIGTSRRRGPVHQDRDYTSRDLGQLVAEHVGGGDVALLFGTEDNGLSREDLLACDATVQIPAWPEYPTLNLSHAATICLYEVFAGLAGGHAGEQAEAYRPRRAEPADLALMERLMAKLQHALLTIGYLNADKPDHLMFPIRAILSRAELTCGEAQILIGLAQQIDEFARYGGKRER
jgi:TrmH family RNA methyltransferase